MNFKDNKPYKTWFVLSFIPLLAVIGISIFYAFAGRLHYAMIEPYTYMQYGFDGLTLIFNRGLHIVFEETVINLFK